MSKSRRKTYYVGGPHNTQPLAVIGPLPGDKCEPCAITGEPVYESDGFMVADDGRWVSIEGILKAFQWTLEHRLHAFDNEWVLTDLLERYGDRKKRRTMNKAVAKSILQKYNFQCAKCGTAERLQVDHIVPVAKGGRDEMANLQILCQPCNVRKGTKPNDQFMKS
jgi:hypothetical protein